MEAPLLDHPALLPSSDGIDRGKGNVNSIAKGKHSHGFRICIAATSKKETTELAKITKL
jgi:hypothetical protein